MNKQVTTFIGISAVVFTVFLVACTEIASRSPSAGEAVSPVAAATVAPAAADAAIPEQQLTAPAPIAAVAVISPPEATAVPASSAAERVAAIVEAPAAVAVVVSASAAPASPAISHGNGEYQTSVDMLCRQIGDKLGSVEVEDCLLQNFVFGGGFSVNQRPLVIREFRPGQGAADDFRVLIMGGVHGDEYSSISILFKWLGLFSAQNLEGEFYWRFAPLVNPDGLLDGSQAKRQNANGVDLNRNFPSLDWNDTAATYWQQSTGSNPRRFPGSSAASEPEVQWIVKQIEEFQPDVIVSLHAPYHLLDFDGPAQAPEKIGELYLHQLGVYPGSLGNFAGLNRRIPVVTLELPSAGILPPPDQVSLMWRDLVAWLDREGRKGLRGQ